MKIRTQRQAAEPTPEKKYRYRLVFDQFRDKPWSYELEVDTGSGWSYSGYSFDSYDTDAEAAEVAEKQIARSRYKPKTYGWVEVR